MADLGTSIDQVFLSYEEPAGDDEVLIQPMLENVIRSGVAFSHDPNTCSPYRIINWSDSEDTTVVTGGTGGRTWIQAAEYSLDATSPFNPIISLLDELINKFGAVPIDCEFAITKSKNGSSFHEKLWLLQARPLILSEKPEKPADQTRRLRDIASKVEKGIRPHPLLMGERTVYGVMPDWNPAEIIGLRPKPLALSLYRELVTDSIWAYQRHNYGYRNLRSFPLMPHFHGLPYIDVRLSFNSFIPNELDNDLAGRLVDYYVDHLVKEPALHDKVEFEIVLSCYTFDIKRRLERLRKVGFSDKDCKSLSNSLRKLTNNIIHPKHGLWKTDADKLDVLISRRQKILSSNMDLLEKIYWLLEDAKRYGTLPFAGLARAGFIAVQMLRSFVATRIFSESDYETYMSSISTVSREMANDLAILSRDIFLEKYGHLRPGTYEILSPRYDETPNRYFDWENRPEPPSDAKQFNLDDVQLGKISEHIKEHNLDTDPENLFNFIENGIKLRELAKFHFSQNLSDVLAMVTQLGKEERIGKSDLAYIDIKILQELYISSLNCRDSLITNIELGKRNYTQTLKTSLPPLITKPEDVWAFELPETLPNFVTHKRLTAQVTDASSHENLAEKVVCIPNADPGFDWLFSYPIAGLITAWGGPNSHMAIRAGELELPAVIGVGDLLYQRISRAKSIHIDCSSKLVEIIS